MSGGALAAGQSEVRSGEGAPPRVDLDANSVTAGVDGLDQRGAGPGDRVEDQVSRSGVVLDECGGEIGRHPRRMGGGSGDVPSPPLGGEAALTDQHDRQSWRPRLAGCAPRRPNGRVIHVGAPGR